MKNALLEIGVEHLPARFVAPALAQMEARAASLLKERRLAYSKLRAEGTLRRLALVIEGVADQSSSIERIVAGPPASLLKSGDGCFTPQALGFARAQGVEPESLEVAAGPKGDVLQVRRTIPGEPAVQVLAAVFPELIRSLEFPKAMEWEQTRLRFARPIRSLLALHGARVVPFSLAGVHSGNLACAASVLSKPVRIPDADSYVERLKDECVLVEAAERRKLLLMNLGQAAKPSGAAADEDAALVEEAVFLTEYPTPVLGSFDPAFLRLPQVLLVTVLKKQLKFFPLLDPAGRLRPGFIGVRDGKSEGQEVVREGYERVLEARFADARFFYERDRRTSLRQKVESLGRVEFHRGLGGMHEKMERTVQLSIWVCGALWRRRVPLDLAAVEAIARLAHADLMTEVVHEFPELQGAMGGHYCRVDGESERIALGVEQFYQPAAARGPLPAHLEACVVSLAGKMDTLAALFLAGLRPTGSEDPLALRRAGMGIVRIALERNIPISLTELAAQAKRLVLEGRSGGPRSGLPAEAASQFDANVREFLWQRLEACFQEAGYPADEIASVAEAGLENLPRTAKKLAAVHALRPNPEFGQLAAAFKRAANILAQAGVDASAHAGVDRTLVRLDAEAALYSTLNRVEKSVFERVAREDYEKALRDLVGLKPFVDKFFETVRVMDAEDRVKRNRLMLLSKLVQLFRSVADISGIQAPAPAAPVPSEVKS